MSRIRHGRRVMTVALAGLALTAFASAACGGDDDDGGKTPTAAVTSAAASPSAAVAAYPLKITDMAGRTVEIKQKPVKIVGISPTAVEMVYAAGGTVLGRSSSVKFPAEAQSAADVGSAYRPAVDKILELKPDLIVGDSVIIKGMPDLAKQMESAGVPVVFVGAESYQDVVTGLDLMGKVLGSTEKSNAAKASIAKARDDAKAALAGKTLSIVALTADEKQQLYAAKENSYVGDIFKQVGLTNPAKDLPDTPPIPGYSLVAPEKLLQLNPDYIFAITPDPRAPALGPTIANIPPFKSLKAVTGNHVVDANLDLFLQAPGPRIGEAFKALAAAINGQPAAAGSASPAASPSATR